MLCKLLGHDLYNVIIKKVKEPLITEIRLRLNRKITVKTVDSRFYLDYLVTIEDIQYVIKTATQNSLYAYQDDIKRSFITYNGIRIGLCGEGVTDDRTLITVKDFTSLIIRIPHEVKGISERIFSLVNKTQLNNILVISPPYSGKTTLIRDIARVYSKNFDTLIIDERNELYSSSYTFGENIDVFSSTAKSLIVENLIRSVSPELIVVDELFPKIDYEIINEIIRSGIHILASIHAPSLDEVKRVYPHLVELFDLAIVLCNKPKVGNIKSLVRL